MKRIISNLLLITFPLILIEILSSFIIYTKEKKVGILFSFFNFEGIPQVEYSMKWDSFSNKLVPGIYKHKLKDGTIINYTINSKGFRNKEFNEKKDSDIRIISFGGSSTMGIETPDDLTYPAQLENIFKNNDYDVEVLNFGFGSKGLNFLKDLFFHEAIKYKPNFITIYSGRNPALYDSSSSKVAKEKIENLYIKKLNLFLINNVMTFRLLSKINNRLTYMYVSPDKIVSPYNKNLRHNLNYFTDKYKNDIEQIINVSNKLKIKVVLIKYALFLNPEIQRELNNKSIKELMLILKNLNAEKIYDLDYSESFWIVTVTVLNKQLEKFKNRENVIIVDPTEKLTSNKSHFEDYVHLTSKGNEVMAELIFDAIKNKIDLKN